MSTSTEPTAGAAEFDPARGYALHPQLALRPERFGALAYHYGNRRLTFLKSPTLTAVVESLTDHATVNDALHAHGIDDAQRPAMLTALARLHASEVICARS